MILCIDRSNQNKDNAVYNGIVNNGICGETPSFGIHLRKAVPGGVLDTTNSVTATYIKGSDKVGTPDDFYFLFLALAFAEQCGHGE